MKTNKLRVAIPLCLLIFALAGFVANVAAGTLSAFGWNDFVMMCPLGALGTMIATKTLIPRAVVAIVVAVVFFLVLGRAFCGWLCPVPVVSRLREAFSGKKKGQGETPEPASGAKLSAEEVAKGAAGGQTSNGAAVPTLTRKERDALKGGCAVCGVACASKRGSRLDARHFVLASALLSTLIFGFPVFCLVCPIGLAFGTVFLFANLFMCGDLSWMTAVVPIVLLVEVVFFRTWCHALCPIGALMSLVAKGNRTFVPAIDDSKCLEVGAGSKCGVCGSVCPEGIDLRHPQLSSAAMSECTKCRACVESCPGDAIFMPLLAKKAAKRPAETES